MLRLVLLAGAKGAKTAGICAILPIRAGNLRGQFQPGIALAALPKLTVPINRPCELQPECTQKIPWHEMETQPIRLGIPEETRRGARGQHPVREPLHIRLRRTEDITWCIFRKLLRGFLGTSSEAPIDTGSGLRHQPPTTEFGV